MKKSLLMATLSCIIGTAYANGFSRSDYTNLRYSTQQYDSKDQRSVIDKHHKQSSQVYSTQQHREYRRKQILKRNNHSMDQEVHIKWSYQQNRQL